MNRFTFVRSGRALLLSAVAVLGLGLGYGLYAGPKSWNCGSNPGDSNSVSSNTKNSHGLYIRTLQPTNAVVATLENGVMSVQGSGQMYDFWHQAPARATTLRDERYDPPALWLSGYEDSIVAVVVGPGVTAVAAGVFSSLRSLKFVYVHEGHIRPGAFADNPNLVSVVLGENVDSIGTFAWVDKYSSPYNIGAFAGCTRLSSVTIGNGTAWIGHNTFRNCAGLYQVVLGKNVSKVGRNAFANCISLSQVVSLSPEPPELGYVQNSYASGKIYYTDRAFDGVAIGDCKLLVQQMDLGPYKLRKNFDMDWGYFDPIQALQFTAVPVTDIINVPASFSVGKTLNLTATVTPSNATNKTIDWSIAGASIAGTNYTGALIDGNKLTATSPGTVVIKATIPEGAFVGVAFERYFFIDVLAEGQSVASFEREVPTAIPAMVSTVAPAVKLTTEFTAGPNPAGKSSGGVVNFFRTGAVIKSATLHVYDASGNVVAAVAIKDNAAVGNNGKRSVGSWDLKDKKGHLVPEGTYLVRGVVKTRDGKSERVSSVVGVR